MPNLNEYLGGLFNSITQARVLADVQSVQVAQQYAQHELLRHFSIPRMRIGDIELTIPVAVDGWSERQQVHAASIDHTKVNSGIYQAVLAGAGLRSLPLKQSQALRAEVARRTQLLEKALNALPAGAEVASVQEQFARDLVDSALKLVVPQAMAPTATRAASLDRPALVHSVSAVIGDQIKLNTRAVLDQLSVVAESHRLREQRPEDLVVIKMTIREDGMEWQTLDAGEGQITRKLLPE
jgi:hypothetical protein